MSTDAWALDMVPQPVVGVLMLFPIKESTEEFRQAEHDRILAEGQVASENTFYMKQTVGNACGTVGILHALLNAKNLHESVSFEPGSYLETFAANTRGLSPDERATYLEEDEELEESHEAAASEGQSEVPSAEEDVNTHFVCFTQVDGQLYELDGR